MPNGSPDWVQNGCGDTFPQESAKAAIILNLHISLVGFQFYFWSHVSMNHLDEWPLL